MNFLYLNYIFKTSCRIDGIDGSEDNWESGNTDNFVGDELGHCDGFLISDKDLESELSTAKLLTLSENSMHCIVVQMIIVGRKYRSINDYK